MDRPDLALALANGGEQERRALFASQAGMLDIDLARALKAVYDRSFEGNPSLSAGASSALSDLAASLDDPEVSSLAEWVAGMAALDVGNMEHALTRLETADRGFLDLAQPHTAASIQTTKLIVLAILGRYDEALETGRAARDIFVSAGDELAAGKMEQNLGNIHARREQHAQSEALFRAAQTRYTTLDDQKQLAQIENCLATALKWQHQFRDAEPLYQQGLERARRENLGITSAEIETNLGLLALFQGRYDTALEYLERSRRNFAQLGLPHQSALSEQELADAYLELNLAPEAAEMCDRAIPVFSELGMRAEHARALLARGRALRLLQRTEDALTALAQAEDLYLAEGNIAGPGMVTLARAEILYGDGRYTEAVEAAEQAEASFAESQVFGRLLTARWLRGDALRELAQNDDARALLRDTLAGAGRYGLPQIAHRCQTSLGLLAITEVDTEAAETLLVEAINVIETLRAPLPAEEFRAAFLTDKLTPYVEMVRLCLADGSSERIVEAFEYVERARSRALVDVLSGDLETRLNPDDPIEAEMLARLAALREELNWFYSQLNRPPDGDSVRGLAMMSELQSAVRERETSVLAIQRQLIQHGSTSTGIAVPIEVPRLQASLDRDTTVVEFFSLDGELLAFIVTPEKVNVVFGLGNERQVAETVKQLRFQMETLRFGATRLAAHMQQLTTRAQRHLVELHDLLFAPLKKHISTRRVVVVPHRSLHYVPFQALFDGGEYLVERFEISYAPSASVLLHCLTKPLPRLDSILLMGVPDERIPRVREEVDALTSLFPATVRLVGEQATLSALREYAPQVDLLHLACHGYFRPDNPLFSSVQLADGWLTVRDAYGLDLSSCGLVTLSACETGVSDVAPGDELIGLARGFISAGAPTILVSLWTVDDEATATLMGMFYRRLQSGDRPAAALRYAQRELIARQPHPFFWSPFVLLGRG
ncbi:MAG: CHAT domain-containing protein [Chloroflexia bacterium]|nr:CHAT domain-containing protein [Chloroflexia bacterium]